jgi:PEP-CTERM motif
MTRPRWLITIGLAAAVLLALGLSPSARADTIIYTIGIPNSGISGYTGPYATLTVTRMSTTMATITFASGNNGTDIFLMGDSGAVALNVNATSVTESPTPPTESNSGTGFTPNGVAATYNFAAGQQEDGFGKFNLTVNNFDGFTYTASSISFTITGGAGTNWTTAAQVLLANAVGNVAAIHVYVCADPCTQSNGALATGYAGNGGVVPEPSSFMLFGFGLLALGFVMRRQLLPSHDSEGEMAA